MELDRALSLHQFLADASAKTSSEVKGSRQSFCRLRMPFNIDLAVQFMSS